jgi:hypothetical protein
MPGKPSETFVPDHCASTASSPSWQQASSPQPTCEQAQRQGAVGNEGHAQVVCCGLHSGLVRAYAQERELHLHEGWRTASSIRAVPGCMHWPEGSRTVQQLLASSSSVY